MNTAKLRNIPAFFLLIISSVSLQAQTNDWLPIPYGQQSTFEKNTGEIILMTCDSWVPGAIGNHFRVEEHFLQSEFDTCYGNVWSGQYNPSPAADFQHFVKSFSFVSITGRTEKIFTPE